MGYLLFILTAPFLVPAVFWLCAYGTKIRRNTRSRALLECHRTKGTRLRDLAIDLLRLQCAPACFIAQHNIYARTRLLS